MVTLLQGGQQIEILKEPHHYRNISTGAEWPITICSITRTIFVCHTPFCLVFLDSGTCDACAVVLANFLIFLKSLKAT